MTTATESKRRSLVKSLIWRLIGIVWTWVGAYFIIKLIPQRYNSAALIATLIVVYHHSTRMIMYYVYERYWASVAWGRTTNMPPLTLKEKSFWTIGTVITLLLIFFLLLKINPRIKSQQKATKIQTERTHNKHNTH